MKPRALGRLKSILALGLALCVGSVISGCAQSSQTQGAQTQGSVVYLDASWPRAYHDLGSLKKDSDIAVAGSITGIANQTVDQNIPYTDFTFQVSQTIVDPKHLVTGSTITIHQTGGVLNKQQFEVKDDPLFHVGEQAVLFLHEYSPGKYFVVGGPTGRFAVLNGLVNAMSPQGVQLAKPVPEATFATQIQQS